MDKVFPQHVSRGWQLRRKSWRFGDSSLLVGARASSRAALRSLHCAPRWRSLCWSPPFVISGKARASFPPANLSSRLCQSCACSALRPYWTRHQQPQYRGFWKRAKTSKSWRCFVRYAVDLQLQRCCNECPLFGDFRPADYLAQTMSTLKQRSPR
eukprot:Amastigsp_a513183_18.p2 type:complete len:155 gc:universal Amastigsp_a513183_18:237-701(+)